MSTIRYLLTSSACLSLFYLAYLLISKNETNFKQFQDAIAALSNDQFRVELDRLNYRTDYKQLVVRIITLVQQPVAETPAKDTVNTITVLAPSDVKDQIVAYFGTSFNVDVITY